MAENGIYTKRFLEELASDQAKTAADRYLTRVHPTELAQAEFDRKRYEAVDENQKLAMLVELRRGNNLDLFTLTIAGVTAFGAGAVFQNFFPYQWQRVAVLPTAVGAAAWGSAMVMKRSYAVRSALAVGGICFALGGTTLGRGPE